MLRPFSFACLVAVASLGWTGWAAAAACSSTNYDLNTQAEVDALGATGCDSVAGDLYIRNSSDITNLNGLANITSVGGDLQIYKNAALSNLDGLANLGSVGGGLKLLTSNAKSSISKHAKLCAGGKTSTVAKSQTNKNKPNLKVPSADNDAAQQEEPRKESELPELANITRNKANSIQATLCNDTEDSALAWSTDTNGSSDLAIPQVKIKRPGYKNSCKDKKVST